MLEQTMLVLELVEERIKEILSVDIVNFETRGEGIQIFLDLFTKREEEGGDTSPRDILNSVEFLCNFIQVLPNDVSAQVILFDKNSHRLADMEYFLSHHYDIEDFSIEEDEGGVWFKVASTGQWLFEKTQHIQ